jgi:hypothetical protein
LNGNTPALFLVCYWLGWKFHKWIFVLITTWNEIIHSARVKTIYLQFVTYTHSHTYSFFHKSNRQNIRWIRVVDCIHKNKWKNYLNSVKLSIQVYVIIKETNLVNWEFHGTIKLGKNKAGLMAHRLDAWMFNYVSIVIFHFMATKIKPLYDFVMKIYQIFSSTSYIYYYIS